MFVLVKMDHGIEAMKQLLLIVSSCGGLMLCSFGHAAGSVWREWSEASLLSAHGRQGDCFFYWRTTMKSRCLLILFSLLGLVLHSGIASGAEPDLRGADKESIKRWMKYYKQIAGEYDIRLEDHPNDKLKPSAQAIHSYMYEADKDKRHGAFFVWTQHGRPEAIGSIWSCLSPNSQTQRTVVHELHSLSLNRLTGKWKKEVLWTPQEAGARFMEIPKSTPPAKLVGLRLAQMRSMAREFKGYVFHGRKVPLRLMPQPLYRYESTKSHVLDGAIFGLFDGWDPEILLLIEARQTEGKTEWLIAPVPFTGTPLALEFAGSSFWEKPRASYLDRTSVFYAPRVEIVDAQLKTKTEP